MKGDEEKGARVLAGPVKPLGQGDGDLHVTGNRASRILLLAEVAVEPGHVREEIKERWARRYGNGGRVAWRPLPKMSESSRGGNRNRRREERGERGDRQLRKSGKCG